MAWNCMPCLALGALGEESRIGIQELALLLFSLMPSSILHRVSHRSPFFYSLAFLLPLTLSPLGMTSPAVPLVDRIQSYLQAKQASRHD